jgi:hypothetical protein
VCASWRLIARAAGGPQVRGVALVGTALVALLIGVSNFLSRIVYDGVYGVPTPDAYNLHA